VSIIAPLDNVKVELSPFMRGSNGSFIDIFIFKFYLAMINDSKILIDVVIQFYLSILYEIKMKKNKRKHVYVYLKLK